MIVVIPCAGYGTRLQSVSGNVHKSLVDVSGKPLLTRIVDDIRTLNPEKIIIVTNSLFYNQFVGWKKKYAPDVILVNDGTRSNDERLGSINDILLGLKDVNTPFMIYSGDNLLSGGLKSIMERFNHTHKNIIVLQDLHSIEAAKKFGVVELDNNNRIIRFVEKPKEPPATLISTGIYILNPEVKKLMHEYISTSDRNHDCFGFFIEHTCRDHEYYGYVLDDTYRWIDIGTPETLKQANELMRK